MFHNLFLQLILQLVHSVEELSGEVQRTHMFQLERVLTCVSEASKDKNVPQRVAGEDDSQILTETQQEFKMDLPTNHEITDVTENAGNLWKSMQECENTAFDDGFIATQEGYQKIRSSGDTSGGEVTKLEHLKNKRQRKIEKQSVEFSAEVVDMWSTMDVIDDEIGTNAGTLWMWLQMRYCQQSCLTESRV